MTQEEKLERNYFCPECNAYLRVWNNIIFTVRSSDHTKQGILLLNPGLGTYAATMHPSLTFEKGEKVEFLCPVCHGNLSADNINQNLVRVKMEDENENSYDVYFSSICGEESTFMVSDSDIICKYGRDESYYINYFQSKLKEKEQANIGV